MDKLEKIFGPTDCISSDVLQKYLQKELDKVAMHGVERHLTVCEMCRDEMEGLSLLQQTEDYSAVVFALNGEIDKKAGQKKIKRIKFDWRLAMAAAASLIIIVVSVATLNYMMSENADTGLALTQKAEEECLVENEKVNSEVIISESFDDEDGENSDSNIQTRRELSIVDGDQDPTGILELIVQKKSNANGPAAETKRKEDKYIFEAGDIALDENQKAISGDHLDKDRSLNLTYAWHSETEKDASVVNGGLYESGSFYLPSTGFKAAMDSTVVLPGSSDNSKNSANGGLALEQKNSNEIVTVTTASGKSSRKSTTINLVSDLPIEGAKVDEAEALARGAVVNTTKDISGTTTGSGETFGGSDFANKTQPVAVEKFDLAVAEDIKQDQFREISKEESDRKLKKEASVTTKKGEAAADRQQMESEAERNDHMAETVALEESLYGKDKKNRDSAKSSGSKNSRSSEYTQVDDNQPAKAIGGEGTITDNDVDIRETDDGVKAEQETAIDSKAAPKDITRGIDLYNANEYKQAIESFDEYLETRPEDFKALFYSAISYLETNQPEEAVRRFDKVLKVKEGEYYDAARLHKARALIKLDKVAEAKIILHDLIKFENPLKAKAEALLRDLE